MKEEFYAHSRDGKPRKDWHRLEDHLKAVAEMARKFASEFGSGDCGGIWGDSGTILGRTPASFKHGFSPSLIWMLKGKPDEAAHRILQLGYMRYKLDKDRKPVKRYLAHSKSLPARERGLKRVVPQVINTML
jgi:hypothetical protein